MADAADPIAPRWSEIDLPDAWTDGETPGFRGALRLLHQALRGVHTRIELPEGLPLRAAIPRYALQEFHNVPNGNYSNALTRGYATGFDIAMLGTMHPARQRMAEALRGCGSALDVGCGGGASTAALTDAGISDVWGLDPSPYLLRCADARVPTARFVQGLAEDTGFADARFDGVSACFVFHEIPPSAADRALAELRRILAPGGRLVIVEPAAEQYHLGSVALARRHGLRALYFRALAHAIHEPFVEAWHRRDVPAWLAAGGFRMLDDRTDVPARTLVCERTGEARA